MDNIQDLLKEEEEIKEEKSKIKTSIKIINV